MISRDLETPYSSAASVMSTVINSMAAALVQSPSCSLPRALPRAVSHSTAADFLNRCVAAVNVFWSITYIYHRVSRFHLYLLTIIHFHQI